MSSLRNAVKRVTHKERSQPQSRSHLGLLEKKGDYRLRSRDYRRKQERLKSMRNKVANRNPDEFYFGMHNSRVDGVSGRGTGRHERTEEARRREMEERGLGPDAVRIMKDQDLAYVRMQRLMDGKKIEKLQSSLHYLEGGGGDDDEEDGANKLTRMVWKKRKHIVFVQGGREEVEGFDVAKHFGTVPELMGRAFNRPRVKTLETQAMLQLGKVPPQDADDDYYNDNESGDEDEEEGKQTAPHKRKQPTEKQLLKQQRKQRKLERSVAKSRSAAYSEMELRNERLMKLKNAEAHLVVEKQVRMKGRRRKIEGRGDGADGKPAVFKWRRKRAR
mmetsp:Transcript_18672/g.40070  ORF Transcript_18672/g.40070 Transcript_18672/m.40070 type:complete len:331 (-) Transcript_18672:225-1217(-)|eukprot:CAMPEP_0172552936 /NCGR_PEP_ID=MMETSP1067-20121228/47280_1 /TAXON_ID=265564 ORGANISM="Thalassiosira punctigera, Strain Tpunct2005C2" /NCGR_SAMPLE_ID=MMETSP1067 /ASSEMBLY_ACC=CAM_ASM_000444 /LENGTH=330 /DNA_ID=CAMNT_0013341011 /DNA_START=142 /DNA_END=1134 /DNA_ORIENTATION=+